MPDFPPDLPIDLPPDLPKDLPQDLPIDFVRGRAEGWRRDIVRDRIRLADEGLSEAQRAELWQVVDCQEWCLRMLVEDFPRELERIDREIEAALRR